MRRVHKPVMLKEFLEVVKEVSPHLLADLTFGQGGHLENALKVLGKTQAIPLKVIINDVDPLAHEFLRTELLRELLKVLNPSSLVITKLWIDETIPILKESIQELINEGYVPLKALILLDLGMSTSQLENKDGFSFKRDTPLDMRFSDEGIPAHELIKRASLEELAKILRDYGELKNAYKIAKAIKRKAEKGLMRTSDLVKAVREAVPEKILKHTLQRVFQAIRIKVNDELEHLKSFCENLKELLPILEGGGGELHLALLTYHSLERRIVKGGCSQFSLVAKMKPSKGEVKENPSSRSAILYHLKHP